MHANPEHPSIAPFQLSWWNDSRIHFDRNPYFFQVDPAGNQLPYTDAFTKLKVESRDVAVFRTMAGETDAYTRAFQLGDLPLLQSNAEKGRIPGIPLAVHRRKRHRSPHEPDLQRRPGNRNVDTDGPIFAGRCLWGSIGTRSTR